MWETMKVDLWGKYITIDAYIQQNKREILNNFMIQIKVIDQKRSKT